MAADKATKPEPEVGAMPMATEGAVEVGRRGFSYSTAQGMRDTDGESPK